MRLTELRPRFQRLFRDFTPETGGKPTDDFQLTFDCPACGPPHRVSIVVGPKQSDAGEGHGMRVWKVTPPAPPDGGAWPDLMTVEPSIDNTPSGHRPPKACSWHGNIVNGQVSSPV